MEANSNTPDLENGSWLHQKTPRRKRGPYKLYLTPTDTDNGVAVPRTTKWRRLQTGETDINDQAEVEEHEEEHYSPHSNNDETEEENTEFDSSADDTEQATESEANGLNETDFNIFEYEDIQDDNCQEERCCQDESDPDPHQNEIGSEHDNIDEPLYDGAGLTVGQCLLLLMAFMLGNNLSGTAIGNLLKLLTLILPTGSRLPKTKFLFDKCFNVFKQGMQFKFYCPDCITLVDTTAETLRCTICDATYQKETLLQKGNYFIYLPLENQIRDLFQKCGDNLDLAYRFTRKKISHDAIEDIYDGQMYKTMAGGSLISDPNALSTTFNCDGVPVFKSSNFGIWPLQGILNELPPKERKENIFLVGLWFGNGKPSMTSFLAPFTEEFRKLSTIGMKWLCGGRNVCSRVFACICSCDSVARCVLQNIYQFNGLYGCSWCENPGESIEKGRGHSRVYVEGSAQYAMRSHNQVERNGRQAYRKQEPVCGVKGPTILSDLPYFDIVRGFVVDNLHCIDLGVSRQLGHLWFDSSNHQQPWYLGRHTAVIDSRMQRIMPPQEITRVPRSLTQRAFWKGSEWHWWLLLYSPVVLNGVLPTPYFTHLLLLVEGVYLLTKSSISRSDINKADLCLSKFVKKFQVLYGKAHMTYNVHQLMHLVQSVIDWGPVSCYSSYIFEGFNMVLLRLFYGTQAVPRQIASSFLVYKAMLQAIPSRGREDAVLNSMFSFMDEQLKGHAPLKKAKTMERNITFLGASYSRKLGIEERYVLEEHFGSADVADDAEFFTKAIVNGNVFHCVNYRRLSRRKNYIVGTIDNITFELVVFAIISFLQCDTAVNSIAFGRQVKLANALGHTEEDCGNLCIHIKRVVETSPVLEIVQLDRIQDKFVVIEDENQQQQFCCKLPNISDRD